MTETTEQRPSAWKRFWRDWGKPIVLAMLLVGTVRSAIADWYIVPTGSMKPTILEGDRIFVNKLAYDFRIPFTNFSLFRWGGPKRGDIVIFPSPLDGTRYVKRVVGVPGDVIELRDNVLFVNGAPAHYSPLAETIIDQLPAREQVSADFAIEEVDGRTHPIMSTFPGGMTPYFGPVEVPSDSYFMMGDNRDNSLDSRRFGFVSREHIAGRATAVVASSKAEGLFALRWQRFFTSLP
ncbi:Signal peptidase I P [Planctomycetes bacterium Pan216]|uniref:Signal peptidase I n=1 Tax=Kolteria novifilia TaxID=2527975 RepID=A0A518AY89_9BACT|nr:Signal peptidase I P [Planctomycetes bacterium Pan216]